MTLPEDIEGFVIYCDASMMGLGAILMQVDKVIAYASRQLKDYEKTHDLGLAAVVFALKIWRYYSYGMHNKIFTVHQSLNYFFIRKELNMRQRRWLELVTNYDCRILNHSSKTNRVAHALSWKSSTTLIFMSAMPL